MNEEINEYIEDLLEVACCPEHDYSCRQVYKYVKQLQSNWNSLREWLKEYSQDLEFRCYMDMVLDKMNELEGKDKE